MSNENKQDSIDLSGLADALTVNSSAMTAEDKAGLVNVLKDKLQSLAGQHSEVLEALTPKVRKRVEVLREIQSQHDELEANFFKEKAALEAKYQKLYEPLYSKRFEIVNGVVEVEGATEDIPIDDKTTEEKGVPEFWLIAMKSNEVLCEEIEEQDEEALKYLKDIKCSRLSEGKGFKLEFFFETNPFFKNPVLTKTYYMIDEEDEPVLEKATGTEIEWYPGKCLTKKVYKKKPKKGSKNARPVTKTEACDSFFNFFSPPEVPEDEDEIDEEIAETLQDQMEQDYDIGSTIRDKIIPHAVSWFTGEAAQDEFGDMAMLDDDDEDDDDEDDEEEEEDDEEEDEDEDEEDAKKTKKRSATGSKKSGASEDQPAECKQQ